MKIAINLNADWCNLIVQEIDRLRTLGFTFETLDGWRSKRLASLERQREAIKKEGGDPKAVGPLLTDDRLFSDFRINLIHLYIDFRYRLVEPKPRTIVYSTQFACPDDLRPGLSVLEDRIRRGESLFPHLSRQIFDATRQDGMLFDWGIHHLHLGVVPSRKDPRLVEGTKEVVYAILGEDVAHFLVVGDHGRWADVELLRMVKAEFPNLFNGRELKGIHAGRTISEKERLQLRAAGAMVPVEIEGILYVPPGGGINTAGGSASSVTKLQQIIYWHQVAEKTIKDGIVSAIKKLNLPQEQLPDSFSFRMNLLEEDRTTVEDVGNRLRAVLFYNAERNGFANFRLQSIESGASS